jgi:rhamnose utilization protein RhaD (predicted bifunctional aldolase and dehydrogenase)
MDKALLELIRISNETGVDPTLVQGGGGNTSVKTADGKYMYIKASGTALKDMNAKEGWRRLRLDLARSVVKDESLAKMPPQTREPEVVNRLLLACDDNVKTEARPSVEAHLHAWLDKCVIHLHPSAAGAYVNARNGKALLDKLFKAEPLPPLWVPYTDPGFMLAKRIARLVDGYQKRFGKGPAMLFLEKHGLFITAGSAVGALRLVRRVIKCCNSKLNQPKGGSLKAEGFGDGLTQATPKLRLRVPPSRQDVADVKSCIERAYFEGTGERAMIWYYNNNAIDEFCHHKDAKKMLSGPLTPDELVYANGPAMWVELQHRKRSSSRAVEKCDWRRVANRLRQQIERGRKPSAAFLVKGVGLLVTATEKMAPTVRDIVLYSIFIRANAHRMGGIVTLNKQQQDFINNWESEAFRKKLASKTS